LPFVLNTVPTHNGSALITYLTNPDEVRTDTIVVRRDTASIARRKVLYGSTLYEQFQLHNYGQEPLRLVLELLIDADFVDIFEVRGTPRIQRGELLPPRITKDQLHLEYRGRDAVLRSSVITFLPEPTFLRANVARFELDLPPAGRMSLEIH